MPGSFERYRAFGHRTVKGWVEPQTLDILRSLSEAQDIEGVDGAVAEIGVHHGKLFIGLQLLNHLGLPAVAVDVFDDQDLNVDQSGRGDLQRFELNVRRWGDWSSVVVKQDDSTHLTGRDVRELAEGPVRLFSVDGGHTEETVTADMRTAEQSIAPGGIVVADDVFNAEWPGVSVGTLRYLDGGRRAGPVRHRLQQDLLHRRGPHLDVSRGHPPGLRTSVAHGAQDDHVPPERRRGAVADPGDSTARPEAEHAGPEGVPRGDVRPPNSLIRSNAETLTPEDHVVP